MFFFLLNLWFFTSPQVVDAAFIQGVEALCKNPVSQRAEVAPEMQLIKASVAFGLYVKKSSPELKNKVQSAMTAFLTRRVGPWVAQQGGWVRRFFLIFILQSPAQARKAGKLQYKM